MKRLAATAVATCLVALPAPAMAQSGAPAQQPGNPFAPLGPTGPVTPPPEPEPAPAPMPQPTAQDDDGFLGTTEALGFAALTAVIIGAVFVAIRREGRRMDQRAKRAHRQRRSKRSARPADLHSGRTATAAAGGGTGERRADAKRPPPPPRKRRAKAKRR
jgi:hypothetical protein